MDREQQLWVDYARVIAIFMVVLLHSASPLLYKFNEIPYKDWMIANIYDSAVRSCVPLFFMISGYLLLIKDEPLQTFLSKRLNKLLIPLVFWSLFFVFFKGYYLTSSGVSFWSFYSLFLSPAYYHLWFLYALIGLYLFLPILRKIINNCEGAIIKYYLAIWFFSASLIPLVEMLSGVGSQYDVMSYSGFVGYFVLGSVLGNRTYKKKHVNLALLVLFACIVITAMGTYYLTANNSGIFNSYLYEYLSPNVILSSVAFFIIIKYIFDNKQKTPSKRRVDSIVRSLSGCSFGIYFIHVIFLYLLQSRSFYLDLMGYSVSSVLLIPMTAISAFLLSYLSIFIIRQTPYLRAISP